MCFDKLVTKSENGVLVLHLKDGFKTLLYCCNCDHEVGSFCNERTANFPIFGQKKITSLVITHRGAKYSEV